MSVANTVSPVSSRAGARADAGPRPHCRVAPAALSLLRAARSGLSAAQGEPTAGARYVGAHLAALRAAAAIVAVRDDPASRARRRRPPSVWELLSKVEPALAEWAAFFAASAAKRAAAEAGLPRAVASCEAEEMLGDAETFLSLAEQALGVPAQPVLPLRTAG